MPSDSWAPKNAAWTRTNGSRRVIPPRLIEAKQNSPSPRLPIDKTFSFHAPSRAASIYQRRRSREREIACQFPDKSAKHSNASSLLRDCCWRKPIMRPFATWSSIVSIFLALLAGCRPAQHQASGPDVPSQLPRTARPLRYSISVVPDAPNLRFSGSVVADLEVLQPTDTITLNAADLEFERSSSPIARTKTRMAAPRQFGTRQPPSSSRRASPLDDTASPSITPARSTSTQRVFSLWTMTRRRAINARSSPNSKLPMRGGYSPAGTNRASAPPLISGSLSLLDRRHREHAAILARGKTGWRRRDHIRDDSRDV